MANVVDLRRADDPSDLVHRAVQILAEGGIVGIPTDTTYVLAAQALRADAVAKLVGEDFADCRKTEFGPSLAVSSAEAAEDYFAGEQALVTRLARRCWPGPVTLEILADHEDSCVGRLPAAVRECLLADQRYLAIRVVGHTFVQQLHRFLPGPLVLSPLWAGGGGAITNGEAAAIQVGERVPLLLDDGPTRYGGPATVVRIKGKDYQIRYEGVVESAAIEKFSKPLLALVCTGNTCRSPMAEVLLRKRLSDLFGREDAVGVVSAGIAAYQGDQASGQAVEVMSQRGLDLTSHCSQPMTEQLLRLADVVLTMTRGHRDAILAKFPDAADRVHTLRLDGGDIADPVGAPLEVYQQCADQIDAQLALWIERLQGQWNSGDQQ